MKIETIEVSKFRSIDSGTFTMNNITAIVGQNNSGKSGLMRALNSFFNPKEELPYFLDGTNLYTSKRTKPRITITFTNVPNNSIYINYIAGGKIKIKQEFNKSRNRLEYSAIYNGTNHALDDNFLKGLFQDVQFILIPAERGAKYSSQNEVTILRKLLDSFFLTHTSKRDTLTPKVRETFNYFKKNALNKVSSGIETKLLGSKGIEIQIESRFPLSYDLFINDLSINVIEEEKEFKLEECGSGVQSLVAISIYRYLAELNHTNFIIGIEEPEINLHPQAQKELIFALLDEVQSNDVQILLTTHSTVLIDQLDHTSIVLVRKEADRVRKFKSTIHQLNPNFWGMYNLQQLQYNKFHKFKNSEFFFANHVLVTESSTDSEVFRILLESRGITIERKGISVLELGGITSLKYAFYLLRDLSIPKTIIIDKDFFFAYQNDSKENSRYRSGFFNYRSGYKNEPLIDDIFNEPIKRGTIENLLASNHSKSLDYTLEFDVICMRYNLEMDLVSSTTAQHIIYNYLNITQANRSTQHLLTNYDKALKKIDLLTHVISNLPYQNFPHSYRKLINRFKNN